jgi:hypothetical protein
VDITVVTGLSSNGALYPLQSRFEGPQVNLTAGESVENGSLALSEVPAGVSDPSE